MLEANQTISFLRLNDNKQGYTGTVVRGCSMHSVTKVSVQDKGLVSGHITRIRIPARARPPNWMPMPGDFVVQGEITEAENRADMGDAIRVMGVTNNERGRTQPHVLVVGE